MADYPALPLWTDAFMADTIHLSTVEIGAYMLLLIAAWRRPGCDLPDDDKYLASITRCDGRRWQHLRPVMAQFHTIADGLWTQKRLQKERKYVHEHSKRMSENARVRWNKTKDIADAEAMPQQCQGYAPTPTPIPLKKDKRVRATRWHPDAAITPEWIEHAWQARQRNSLPEIDLLLEAEKFTNFWSSKSGADATKIDWHKTWINWALKAEGARHANTKGPSAHDKFIAAGFSIIERLGAPEQTGDDPEDDGAGKAVRALPPA